MENPLYFANPSCGTHRSGTMGYVSDEGYSANPDTGLMPEYGRSDVGQWWDRITPGETNYERAQRMIAEDKAHRRGIEETQRGIAKFQMPEIGVAPILVTILGIGAVLWFSQQQK